MNLKNVLKKTWFTNKDNHVIKISTPYENSLWQIFSIYYIETEGWFCETCEFNEYSILKTQFTPVDVDVAQKAIQIAKANKK